MNTDNDIKIAGDKPSRDVKRNREQAAELPGVTHSETANAKKLGEAIARIFIDDSAGFSVGDESDDPEMLDQKRLLLSFTATVGFEQTCKNDTLSGVAQKSFLDTLRKCSPELYHSSSDTGAFSFYYLAFRRGGEVDRRMGQTFAMLCSHDGDPIYQELGEALYCWFLSRIEKIASELSIN